MIMTLPIWVAVLYAAGAFLSGVAACLAWAAKLWWSSEFAAAKDAQIQTLQRSKDEMIQAKDAQIKTLQLQLEIRHDTASPTHAGRHADPESVSAHTTVVRPASLPIRTAFWKIAGAVGTGGDSRVSGVPDQ